jgi:hypothetical protein
MAKLTVVLLGMDSVIQNEDDKAAAAITPGMLVAYDASGNVVPHATAGGNAARMFALEREEAGGDMNAVYAIGDTVKIGYCPPGVRVNALIGVVNATKGALLESDGTGKLRLLAAGVAVAQALEALNNAAGVARLRVQVI